MFSRPKPGENEEDILKLQEAFLKEKQKNKNLQPAATVLNLRNVTKISSSETDTAQVSTAKISKYAKEKGLRLKKVVERSVDTAVVGDIVEHNEDGASESKGKCSEDDQVYFPKSLPFIIGEVFEKNTDFNVHGMSRDIQGELNHGFPTVKKSDPDIKSKAKKSIFAQQMERDKKLNSKDGGNTDIIDTIMETDDETLNTNQIETMNTNQMDISESSDKLSGVINQKFPERSFIVADDSTKWIHYENINLLKKMSEKEIMEERQKLLSTLDPTLINFIKSKRHKRPSESTKEEIETSTSKVVRFQMDPDEVAASGTSEAKATKEELYEENLFENDIISHPSLDKWVHFDMLEKDKLEWIKGIQEKHKVNPDEPYEARFDFKGYLLPYSVDYTEETKSLFHHGSEPHRPGYTILELFQLSRSTLLQQRGMALNTLAGILEYYSTGIYHGIIEIPVTKIFFIIRFTLDENKIIILEASLRAMRNLFYNRVDEACLDALLGFHDGLKQPSMLNDKSEIKEIQSDESELKDFHLADVDLITAAVRMDLLIRIRYVLCNLKLTFNCVHYCLQILTRLARDSVETASKIISTEGLIECIVAKFLPETSINFIFKPEIVYEKPILSAIKCIRILMSQSKENAIILVEDNNVLRRLRHYIASPVDGTYGLRIQTESFYVFAIALNYRLGLKEFEDIKDVVSNIHQKKQLELDIFLSTPSTKCNHLSALLELTLVAIETSMIDKSKGDMFYYMDRYCYMMLKEGVMKWILQLCTIDTYSCGNLRLLSSCLNCIELLMSHPDVHKEPTIIFSLPVETLIPKLLSSKGLCKLTQELLQSSNLLSTINGTALHFTKNLVSLGGSMVEASQKVPPTLNTLSPIPFLLSLLRFINTMHNLTKPAWCISFIDLVRDYLTEFKEIKMPNLCENWFSRVEILFLFNTIKFFNTHSEALSVEDRDMLYLVSNKLCYVLRSDMTSELKFIFENVIFNKKWVSADRLLGTVSISDSYIGINEILVNIGNIMKQYTTSIRFKKEDPRFEGGMTSFTVSHWQHPILPRDWVYMPIVKMYAESQDKELESRLNGAHASKVYAEQAKEKEMVIVSSLEWIYFSERCFPDHMNEISVTDRFCRLMCVFLCDNSIFLDKRVSMLIENCMKILFSVENREKINFNTDLTGMNNFQDFYTQMVEQFQAVSYGEPMFASCILVPLAQRHDSKWRKLVWSEYAGCLRVLDCPENLLCYNIDEYLYPEETDMSILKSYAHALSGNLLRTGTVTHRIALHHVTSAKNRARNKTLNIKT